MIFDQTLHIQINPVKVVNSVFITEHKGGVLPSFEVKPSDKWDSEIDIQLEYVYDLIKNQKIE